MSKAGGEASLDFGPAHFFQNPGSSFMSQSGTGGHFGPQPGINQRTAGGNGGHFGSPKTSADIMIGGILAANVWPNLTARIPIARPTVPIMIVMRMTPAADDKSTPKSGHQEAGLVSLRSHLTQ